MLSLNGASSATATTILSTVVAYMRTLLTPLTRSTSWRNFPATFTFSSAGLAVIATNLPATGASAAASNTTGVTSRLPWTGSVAIVTPCGSSGGWRATLPPKSGGGGGAGGGWGVPLGGAESRGSL